MKAALAVALAATVACDLQGPIASPPSVAEAPRTPIASLPKLPVMRPKGRPRCASAPVDYPDADTATNLVSLDFSALASDPAFAARGIDLVSFRTEHLVVHASRDADPAFVTCAVVAGDDAFAFVDSTLDAAPSDDDAPRELLLLSPNSAPDVLERLDPRRHLGTTEAPGRFVAVTDARSPFRGIVQFREVEASYLEVGFQLAHERVHLLQAALGAAPSSTPPIASEGEANLFAVRWEDAVFPGYGTLFWDHDARRIEASKAAHPELGPASLFGQSAHGHHDELTLFSVAARDVDARTLWSIHRRAHADGVAYDDAFARVVGRPFFDAAIDDAVRDPKSVARPSLGPLPLAITVVVERRGLRFVATGFAPGEAIARSIHGATGNVDAAVRADDRGVVAWGSPFANGSAWTPRDVTLQGQSGAVRARYFDRAQ